MGQYIGSGSPALAKKSAYTAIKLVLIYALIVALACMLFPGPLVRIFNEDPVVVALGRRAMIWAALFLIFDAIQMVSNGALRGAGDTKAPMMITLGGAWFLFIPLAYLFGSVLGGGVVWAWAGGVIYTVFLAAALFRRLRQDRWRAIRIE
jgi:MATE family multidrug resistance protein